MRLSARVLLILTFLCNAAAASAAAAQLFFREDWKETPAELPVSQDHVANPDLLLQLYGPGLHGIKKSNHPPIPNDPYYIWSGACPGNWAVTLKHKTSDVDLRGPAIIRWRSKQSGFRQLRIILKTATGNWYVSDAFDGASDDWHVREFPLASVRWHSLDISRVAEAKPASPDLSHVQEIGFSDLMTGGMSDACSRLDWIEVFGTAVSR